MEIKMNQRGNYISKGVYLHPQIPGFVAVKQYIFCRQNEKKCLILKFSNNCDFKLSAMSFTVVPFLIMRFPFRRGAIFPLTAE